MTRRTGKRARGGEVSMRWLLGAVFVVALAVVGCASGAPAPSPVAVAPSQQPFSAPTSTPTLLAASPTSAVAQVTPTGALPVATPARVGVALGTTPTRAAIPARVPTASGPLLLAVDEPAEDTVEVPAAARTLTVAGRTRPGAVLSINGRLVQPDASGGFRADVPLDDDMTLVEIIASDAAGQELRQQIVAVRE